MTPPMERKLLDGAVLPFLRVWPHQLAWNPALSRHSINLCWGAEGLDELMGMWTR